MFQNGLAFCYHRLGIIFAAASPCYLSLVPRKVTLSIQYQLLWMHTSTGLSFGFEFKLVIP